MIPLFLWNRAAPDKTPNLNQSWLTSLLCPSILCHPVCDPPTMPWTWYQHGLTLKLMTFCMSVSLGTSRRKFFSQDETGVSLMINNSLEQISHQTNFPFTEAINWFGFRLGITSTNLCTWITDLWGPFIGKVRQDDMLWWFEADITLSLLYRNSDKKISTSSEKHRVFIKSLEKQQQVINKSVF